MHAYRLLLPLMIFSLLVGACATPSPTPTPTPVPTATPTWTPTPKPTSTPTPTPTSTPFPTPTFTPTPIQVSGLDKDAQPLLNPSETDVPADWVWFESEAFDFRIAYPPDWLALDLTAEDWEAILKQVGNEDVQALLNDQARRMIVNHTIALITAAIPEEGVEGQTFVSNLNILRVDVPADVAQDALIQQIITNLRRLRGLRLESMNRGQIRGYPSVAVLYTYPLRDQEGDTYPVVGWQVYVRAKSDRLYVLTFTTLASSFEKRITTFAKMAGSFQLISDGNK